MAPAPKAASIGVGTGYAMVQIPAAIYAWRAFKMHESMTGMDSKRTDSSLPPDKKTQHTGILAHEETSTTTPGTFWIWVNESTVCPLGKFGAATIMIWLIVSTVLMFVLDLKMACFVVGLVSVVMYLVMNALSAWLNKPLAIRAFPFFLFQFGLSALLITIAYLLS